jgi:uncharacterized RDD family membrane protein YckC
MKRVGFWLRVLASLIDSVFVLLLLMFSLAAHLLIIGNARSSRLFDGFFWTAILIYTATEVFLAGTPGKRILRIKIGRNDCTSADKWRLGLRWSTKQLPLILLLLFIATNWLFFTILRGLTAAVVFFGCFYAANDDKLSWHDQWAGTAVYRTRDLAGK